MWELGFVTETFNVLVFSILYTKLLKPLMVPSPSHCLKTFQRNKQQRLMCYVFFFSFYILFLRDICDLLEFFFPQKS